MLCMVAMDTLAVVRFLLYLRLVIETAIGSSNFFLCNPSDKFNVVYFDINVNLFLSVSDNFFLISVNLVVLYGGSMGIVFVYNLNKMHS